MKYGEVLLNELRKSRSKYAKDWFDEIESQQTLGLCGSRVVVSDEEYARLKECEWRTCDHDGCNVDVWSETEDYNTCIDDAYGNIIEWLEEDGSPAPFERWAGLLGVRLGWNKPHPFALRVWCRRDKKWVDLDKIEEHDVANPDDPYIQKQYPMAVTWPPSAKQYFTHKGERYTNSLSPPDGKNWSDEVVE